LSLKGKNGCRRSLQGCRLRIYTEENYLDRWRRVFARGMGVSVIPDGREMVAPPRARDTDVTGTREAFLAHLGSRSISKSRLAEEMGVSLSLVSQHLTGKRGWTAAWRSRLEDWVKGQAV
jgi:hypothetical protein